MSLSSAKREPGRRFDAPELMNEPEHQSARMQGLDAAAHEAFVPFGESRKPISHAVLDERITVCAADPAWPSWFQQEAAQLRSALPGDLVPDIQHIGNTAVPGLDAKPIVDLMVGIGEPGRIAQVVEWLERLGYESLGEAGVPGRWALRKRGAAQPSILQWPPTKRWWKLKPAVRDFLRANADAARNYASAKCCCQQWRRRTPLCRFVRQSVRKDCRGLPFALVRNG